ncbi:MAG: cytochrome c oxidase assembly protein [Myxococcales bacterium]|nr:cytochrome c oxidase assembly protein [Myxococcales bacterium]
MRAGLSGGACLLTFIVWVWPVPHLEGPPFTRHMVIHMTLVAIIAPLIAGAVSGTSFDPSTRGWSWFRPLPLSALEAVVVWSFHAPALHHAARSTLVVFVLEQLSFLLVASCFWTAVLGGTSHERKQRALESITALLGTAMHMTLLGALLALSKRELYAQHVPGFVSPADRLFDQNLGGAVMIVMGGAIYLAGGIALTAEALRPPRADLPNR